MLPARSAYLTVENLGRSDSRSSNIGDDFGWNSGAVSWIHQLRFLELETMGQTAKEAHAEWR